MTDNHQLPDNIYMPGLWDVEDCYPTVVVNERANDTDVKYTRSDIADDKINYLEAMLDTKADEITRLHAELAAAEAEAWDEAVEACSDELESQFQDHLADEIRKLKRGTGD